ncbi:MAG TPA: F0F1 ATP synthase subunit B [Candidatus Chromulinivoraceae bacterium]|nr:F0F1 ATP synthase subunit B [Candidatus Chromulinivoraceae bacterium]
MNILGQFAEAAPSGDLFTALGIDWKMLVFQLVAFVILVFLLGKFVYPSLMKAVDKRQANIEEAARASESAQKQADKTKTEVEELLKQARQDASSILTTAKEEANAAAERADAKAKARAERIVADAHEQVEKDIVAARKALHNETLTLVALATEKVVGKAMTDKIDEKVIATSLEEAK